MNKTFEEIKGEIENLINILGNSLDTETINSVRHYIDHDEYEMAAEGLFIELMKLKSKPEIDLKKCREIALDLNLDKESVFDHQFWSKFDSFTT